MNWRRIFLENIGFKVAALVVVAMLWVSVTADERQAQPVPTELSVEVRDSAWVLVEAPAEVSTTFQGTTRAFFSLLTKRPVVHVAIDSVTAEHMQVSLPVDQLDYDREAGVTPSYITPSTVDLRFERRRSARVPVVADVDPMPAAGYTVVQPIRVQPESVTVHGPASWVEGLSQLSTRFVRLEDLTHTVLRDIPLDVPSGVRGATAEPSTVLVTVDLDSLVVRELRVPVRMDGAAAGSARIEPDSATVGLRGVASAVDSLAGRIAELSVDVAEPPEAPFQVTLRDLVDAGSDGPVAVTVTPSTATIGPRS